MFDLFPDLGILERRDHFWLLDPSKDATHRALHQLIFQHCCPLGRKDETNFAYIVGVGRRVGSDRYHMFLTHAAAEVSWPQA